MRLIWPVYLGNTPIVVFTYTSQWNSWNSPYFLVQYDQCELSSLYQSWKKFDEMSVLLKTKVVFLTHKWIVRQVFLCSINVPLPIQKGWCSASIKLASDSRFSVAIRYIICADSLVVCDIRPEKINCTLYLALVELFFCLSSPAQTSRCVHSAWLSFHRHALVRLHDKYLTNYMSYVEIIN